MPLSRGPMLQVPWEECFFVPYVNKITQTRNVKGIFFVLNCKNAGHLPSILNKIFFEQNLCSCNEAHSPITWHFMNDGRFYNSLFYLYFAFTIFSPERIYQQKLKPLFVRQAELNRFPSIQELQWNTFLRSPPMDVAYYTKTHIWSY